MRQWYIGEHSSRNILLALRIILEPRNVRAISEETLAMAISVQLPAVKDAARNRQPESLTPRGCFCISIYTMETLTPFNSAREK